MRFADLQSFTLSPCFVEFDRWRQVITEQMLSSLFFATFFLGFVLVKLNQLKVDQWRQIIIDRVLSPLFFLGLVLVGGFGPGTTAEVTNQSISYHFFPIILGEHESKF